MNTKNLPACGMCKYWKRIINKQDLRANQGECRFNPPTATVIPVRQGTMVVTTYPQRKHNDEGCFQFSPAMEQTDATEGR